MATPCPCGRGRSLAACCGPLLEGRARPDTAEDLMRSRYAAYALGYHDYLIESHDPATRGDLTAAALRRASARTTWTGLEIRRVAGDRVEFVARFGGPDGEGFLHEDSRFRILEGRWVYVDGRQPVVGRNDPCPCGSRAKHKKCCGR